MEILSGIFVVVFGAALAIWCNDNLPFGEYIADEVPSHGK